MWLKWCFTNLDTTICCKKNIYTNETGKLHQSLVVVHYFILFLLISEDLTLFRTRRCSVKKMFLKIFRTTFLQDTSVRLLLFLGHFNLSQDETFRGCSVTTCYSYTLPKEDPKIYKSCDTPFEFCCHQHHRKSEIYVILENKKSKLNFRA